MNNIKHDLDQRPGWNKVVGQRPKFIFQNMAMLQSTKKDKDKESIQSSTTPDPGYQWESDNFTIRHHKREPRGHPQQASTIHQ